WDLKDPAPKETTKNLMDYSGGQEMLASQWLQIQDPNRKLYAFDDAEDAAISISSEVLIRRLMNDIFCALHNSEPSAKVYTKYHTVGNSGIPGDMEDATYWGFKIHGVEFHHITSDIIFLDPQFEEVVIAAHGKEYKVIRFRDDSDKAVYIDITPYSEDYDALVGRLRYAPSDFILDQTNLQIAELNKIIAEGDQDDINQFLYNSSRCFLSQMPMKNRIELLEHIANYWQIDTEDEELIVRILESFSSPTEVEYFVENATSKEMWSELFEDIGSNTNFELFAGQIVRLSSVYYANGKSFNVVGFSDVKSHTLKRLGNYQFKDGGRVDLYEEQKIEDCAVLFAGVFFDCGTQDVLLIEDANMWDLVTVTFENDNTYANIESGQKIEMIPVGLIVYFTQQQLDGKQKQKFYTALDVALCAVGGLEVRAAITGLRATGYTLTGLLRLSVGILDLAALGADIACTANDTELCDKWKKVSLYVNLGLVSVGSLNQLADIISRTKNIDEVGDFSRRIDEIVDGRVA
ncbi:MAG: hypothetical protein HRT71_08135, partial [Flavobacteriales bacterium]|nr:hypothetical protein [Flavobacteriales bacterium]